MKKALILLLALAACADPYADTQKIDTIEAWETFLTNETPSQSQRLGAEQRLEELMIQKAEASKAIADYDAVLKRFPKSKQAKKLKEARVALTWAEAEATNTPEGWKKFLDENETADGALKKKARERVAVSEYGSKMTVGPVTVAEVNLAEDPKGPKDGWGFTSEVVNGGDQTIEYMNMELQYLDGAGAKLKAASYPLVAQSAAGMPVSEETAKPFAPGEKRIWTYTTGQVPDAWAEAKQVNLVITAIRFTPPPK